MKIILFVRTLMRQKRTRMPISLQECVGRGIAEVCISKVTATNWALFNAGFQHLAFTLRIV
jgi:hypothetical protein